MSNKPDDFSPAAVAELVEQAAAKGFDHYNKGDHPAAEAVFRQVMAVDPNNLAALQMVGLIESKKDGAGEGMTLLYRALEIAPDDADVHNNLGLVFSWSDVKDADKAEYHFKKAIELRPTMMHVYGNLGILYRTQARYDDAEDVMLKGIAGEPSNAHLNFNYATLLGELRRWPEARLRYEKVMEIDPEFASAHFNLSNLLLSHGEYETGWREYEWRWQTYPQFMRIRDRFGAETQLVPGSDLAGKTVLLYAEQGTGDTIQFVRYAKNLHDAGATVVIEEHAEILPLLETCPWIDRTVTLGQDVGDFDLHSSVLGLPYAIGLNDEAAISTVPVPYLGVNRDKLPEVSINDEKNWDVYDGWRVGIVWAGNPQHKNDHIRSCKLVNFRALQVPRVKLFSLQKDARPRFWPGLGTHDLTEGAEGMSVVDLKDFIFDYNLTAAIIDRMDLVVAVDTATAHLAGAMGKPVWLLTARHSDWRWLIDRVDTPWYPTMRIFRQAVQHDWDAVFARVGRCLTMVAATRTLEDFHEAAMRLPFETATPA